MSGPAGGTTVLLTLWLRSDQDVVEARSRGRQLASLLGFSGQDQTRVATAVSELARNALMYAGGGRAEYGVNPQTRQLTVRVSDQGPGIRQPDEVLSGRYVSATGMGRGLLGTRRLMDSFELDTGAAGTRVAVAKTLPPATMTGTGELEALRAALTREGPATPAQELQRQNQELLRALSDLVRREEQLATLNRELEDTNRGVVALYSELEDKASRLREANREKSMFLSYVSHEFRTPLHSMLGLSRMLLSHDDGELSGEQDQQLRLLRSSAEELLGMVNDLLDLTKAESGGQDLNLEPLDLSQLLATLRALFLPLVTASGPRLIVEEPAEPTLLHSDSGKLHQILRNFISNALKFTQTGEVVMSTRRLEDPDWIEFSVQDSGPGIAAEDQSRLFQAFSQLGDRSRDAASSASGSPVSSSPVSGSPGPGHGSGLGLSLASRMATLLGGRVGVESALGQGSRFWAVLPVHLDRRGAAPAEAQASGSQASAAPVQAGGERR